MARKRKPRLTARTADRYVLYTNSVQTPEVEVTFFERLYTKLNGRPPVLIREDFCGTAAVCCQWAHVGSRNRAIGVDIDPEPLAWSRKHYLAALKPDAARRVELRRADVLRVRTPPADVILALNFSYCVFKERKVLIRYLHRCLDALARGGIMIMDIYGGAEAHQEMEEETKLDGYTYIWDQAEINPVTSEVLNHIHYRFPDGTRLRKAFTYDWRLWTLRELTEAMEEVGFRDARVYWEDANDKGEGTGVYRYRKNAPPEEAWVAYVVGIK